MGIQANLPDSAGRLEVAEKLSSAFSRKDVAALRGVYHENAEIWHNYDDKTLTMQEAIERVEVVFSSFKELNLKNIRRFATETGFVQQHDISGTHINGESLNVPGCQIATVEAGKISRLENYVDRGPLSAMLSAN